jgi:CBS domain containing-hemolysin-like protein
VNTPLWVVLGAAALSCFFALADLALRSFRRVSLEEAFDATDRLDWLVELEKHLNGLQLTASLCRVLANLVLVTGLLFAFGGLSPFWRVAGAVATGGVIIAIFGVAIPHAWSSHAGEKTLPVSVKMVMGFRYLLYPLVRLMESFDLPVRRLCGVHEQEEDGESAKQDILHAASEGQAEGAVDAEEVQMIESIMEFGETQAGEIMTPRTDIVALPIETPFDEAVNKIVQAGHTRVPVYEGDLDNMVGVLYAKDLLKHHAQGDAPELRNLLRKCYFVPETIMLDDLLKQFKIRKVHLAILLDEYGGTSGLVSIEDLLEEIVGDIDDEYDPAAEVSIHRVDDRTAEVDGRVYIDELNEAMDLEIPEDEDYDTIAGFLFSELGYIPTTGEMLDSHGARFTIMAADERKITRVRVELPEPHSSGANDR